MQIKQIAILFSIILLLFFEGISYAAGSGQVVGRHTLQRISPVGQVNIVPEEMRPTTLPNAQQTASEPAASPSPPQTNTAAKVSAEAGQKVYEKVCQICHATGVAGAPKFKDNAAWKERGAQGMTVLLEHVEKGYKTMPPKGSCAECSNEELESAILYMLTQANVVVDASENDAVKPSKDKSHKKTNTQ